MGSQGSGRTLRNASTTRSFNMLKLGLALFSAFSVVATAATFAEVNTTVDIGGGVQMPRINLGTCCGSDPRVGLPSWIEAGGVGVDSAWDYGNQANLSAVIKASGKPRSSFFITSKVPAGDHMAGTPGIPGACDANPNASLAYVRDSLKLLGVDQLDLVMIHSSCANYDPPVADAAASDNALWQGLMQAKQQGLTRAIGVSNFNMAQLKLLKGVVPAVNQIPISLMPFWGHTNGHDDLTLDYCAAHSITPQSYGTLRGCPFADHRLITIAKAHSVTESQVCMRWVLQRGAVIAAGTGSNATKAPGYARENIGIFDFELSSAEMITLNAFSNGTAAQ